MYRLNGAVKDEDGDVSRRCIVSQSLRNCKESCEIPGLKDQEGLGSSDRQTKPYAMEEAARCVISSFAGPAVPCIQVSFDASRGQGWAVHWHETVDVFATLLGRPLSRARQVSDTSSARTARRNCEGSSNERAAVILPMLHRPALCALTRDGEHQLACC